MAAGAALATQPAFAQTWVSYDTFSGSTISSARWAGEEGRQAGGLRLDSRRGITSGQLRIEMRGVGDNVRNDLSSSVRNSVLFANGAAVTGMRSTVTMRSFTLNNCAANTSVSSGIRARLFGFFFNAGTPVVGSFMNDVFAGIQVGRTSTTTDDANLFRVTAFIGMCSDDNCVGSKSVASKDILLNVGLNTPIDMSVAWDRDNNAFLFSANGTTDTLTYTLNDTNLAVNPNKRMEVSNNMQTCTSRILTAAVADFDNVYTSAPSAAAAVQSVGPTGVETAAQDDRVSAN